MMPVLCGMGDAYRKGTEYEVRGFTSENEFMDAVRAAEQECERLTLPSLFVGAGLGALFVFVTALAIVMWG